MKESKQSNKNVTITGGIDLIACYNTCKNLFFNSPSTNFNSTILFNGKLVLLLVLSLVVLLVREFLITYVASITKQHFTLVFLVFFYSLPL